MFGPNIVSSKFHRIRERWELKTPKQKWESLFNTGRKAAELAGSRVYSDNKHVWYTPAGAIVISTCIAMILYTIPFYCLRNEFVRSIECSCPLGIIIPVSLICFI